MVLGENYYKQFSEVCQWMACVIIKGLIT